MNAMKNAADVKRQKSMKKQLIVQYLAAIAMLTLGAVFTGISIFAFSASYVKKSEYNEIDKTARTIIKNFEICLNSSDSRETAVSDMERFFAVYSDVFDTNYYILDKDGGIIVKSEADTEKYKPETVSRLINAAEFDIVNSEVIIYSKKMPSVLSDGGVYFIALKPADEYYRSVIRIGEVLIISITVVFIIFSVILYLVKRRKFNLLMELNEYASDFVETGTTDKTLPETSDMELASIISAMNKMTEIIASNNKHRLEFMSNVSHELKTPVTIINGFVTGILDGTIERDQQRRYLVRVSDQTNRMVRSINTMMKISGIESGDMQLNRRMVDLTALFVETLFMFEKQIEDKNVTVEGIDSPKIMLYGDKDILYQIVYNLVDNAVKFVNSGGVIKLNTHSDQHNIYLWFGNTGRGISGREMSRIFDRFYKTDFSRSHDTSGVGLGLSIVKKFVEFHHGSIILKSNQDEYTEFLLTFPVDKFNVVPAAESEDNEDSENKPISGEKNER